MNEVSHAFGLSEYLTFLGCIVLGQFFHLIVKANSLKKKAIASNKGFSLVDDFLKVDFLEILGALVACFMVMIGYSELIGFYPKIALGQKIFFLLLGYSGSSWVLAAFSKADKIALNTINNLNIEKMEEFEWYLQYQNAEDTVSFEEMEISLDDFAVETGGNMKPTVSQIVWTAEPAFGELVFNPGQATTYIAGPIRRPTGA